MRNRILVFTLLFVLLAATGCQTIPIPLPPAPAEEEAEVTVLAEGAPLSMANGAMFGADGNLYVASVLGSEIVAIDPDTGEFIKRYTQEQGVNGPDDIAFGPDGSLYWTSLFTGEVGRLSPDGVKTGQTVAPGVNPITFSDDGRLFVALDILGAGLYELDPEFQEPPRLLSEDVGRLNGMDFGPDGLLYAPAVNQSGVVRIDVDADPVTADTVVDGMTRPIAAKFDSQGRLHVLDLDTGEVWRVDVDSGEKELLVQLKPRLDNLAFSPDGRLFVTNNLSGAVWEVLDDGSVREVVPGGMIGPMGIAVVGSGDSEIVYTGNVYSLYAFDGTTGETVAAGLPIPAVTVAPFGDNLVTSFSLANVVMVLDPGAGTPVAALQDFAVPVNAIAFQGDLVVVELATAHVVRAGGDDFSERIILTDELTVPLGLAAGDDDLWIGDVATGMVWQIVADGDVLAEPRAVAEGLAAPSGLALADNGDLLVVEAGRNRLLAIDPETGATDTVAEGLALAGPPLTGAPPLLLGVAVGPSGSIYLAGDAGNVLYRIMPQ